MAITSFDGYLAGAKQRLPIFKTGARTTVANGWFTLHDVAGAPGAGTLAGTSTTAGVVPTSATAGYPAISSFGGNPGYLSRVSFASSVACRIKVVDRLWLGGAYAFNANQALSSQPSFSGRVPNTIYNGLEIWAEAVTAFTGNQTFNVTYENEAAVGSKTTGAVGIGAAPTVGRCWQLPLQAGDKGVSKITNVLGATGSAGTANIMVVRPLWEGRVTVANAGGIASLLDLMQQVYDTSALYMLVNTDSTASGIPELYVDVVSG